MEIYPTLAVCQRYNAGVRITADNMPSRRVFVPPNWRHLAIMAKGNVTHLMDGDLGEYLAAVSDGYQTYGTLPHPNRITAVSALLTKRFACTLMSYNFFPCFDVPLAIYNVVTAPPLRSLWEHYHDMTREAEEAHECSAVEWGDYLQPFALATLHALQANDIVVIRRTPATQIAFAVYAAMFPRHGRDDTFRASAAYRLTDANGPIDLFVAFRDHVLVVDYGPLWASEHLPTALNIKDEMCAICRDNVSWRSRRSGSQEPSDYCTTACTHVFHRTCLQSWLDRTPTPNRPPGTRQGSCPTCRAPIAEEQILGHSWYYNPFIHQARLHAQLGPGRVRSPLRGRSRSPSPDGAEAFFRQADGQWERPNGQQASPSGLHALFVPGAARRSATDNHET